MGRTKTPLAMQRTVGNLASALAMVVVLCTWQVFSHPILEDQMLLDALAREGASMLTSRMSDLRLQSLRRFTRMTPFWRMVGSKPLGAYCLQGLECTTKLCRKGHCAYQQQFES
ncbi:liver-expressed antimicrobial peptide 2 [Lissotriton helveticus]